MNVNEAQEKTLHKRDFSADKINKSMFHITEEVVE